jgi:hypothetical protein
MAADMIGRAATSIGDDTSDDGSGGGIDLSGLTDAMQTVGQVVDVAGSVMKTAVPLATGVIKTVAAIQQVGKPPPAHVVANQILNHALAQGMYGTAVGRRPAPPTGYGPPQQMAPAPMTGMAPGGMPGIAPGAGYGVPASHSMLPWVAGVGGGSATGLGIGYAVGKWIGLAIGGVLGAALGAAGAYMFARVHIAGTASVNTSAGSVGLTVVK